MMPGLGRKDSVGKTAVGFDNGYAYGGALDHDISQARAAKLDGIADMASQLRPSFECRIYLARAAGENAGVIA